MNKNLYRIINRYIYNYIVIKDIWDEIKLWIIKFITNFIILVLIWTSFNKNILVKPN